MKALRRGRITVALAGVAAAAIVFALVVGSRPLYEAQAGLSAPAPGLLEQFDRLTALDVQPARGTDSEATLGSRDLGDVGAVVEAVRRRLGLHADSGTLDVSIDSQRREVSIAARHSSPATSKQLANGVVDGIISQRSRLLSGRLAEARTELVLVATLARRSRPLVARARTLGDRITGLVQLRATEGAGLSTLRRAKTPTEPVAPRPVRDVIFGALLGMLSALSVRALFQAVQVRRRTRTLSPS